MRKILIYFITLLLGATQVTTLAAAQTRSTIVPVTIKATSNLNGIVGTDFLANFEATGGTGAFRWEITSGTLPGGLTLKESPQPLCPQIICGTFRNSIIMVTGTPTMVGSFQFGLTAYDANKLAGTGQFLMTISAGAPAPNPAPGPANTLTYSVSTDKTSYQPTDMIAITISAKNSGAEDQILKFNTSCQVNYQIGIIPNTTTTQVCADALTQVTIKPQETKTWPLTHNLNNYPIPGGSYALKGIVLGYGEATTNITISGSNSQFLLVTSPKLGDQLEVGKTYAITWASGSGSHATTSPATATITLNKVAPTCVNLAQSCLPPVPAPFTITNNAPDNGNHQWQIPSTLPSAYFGKNQITVSVNNSVSGTSDVFSILGLGAPTTGLSVSLSSMTLNGFVGKPYSSIFRAAGGKLPYAFSLKSGKLPTGMSLQTTTCATTNTAAFACTPDMAVMSGTPIEAGTFTFEIQATDSTGISGSAAFTATISPAGTKSLNIITDSNLNAEIGKYFNAIFSADGSQGGVTYTISRGNLPPGLSIGALIPECAPPGPGIANSGCGPINSALVAGTPTTAGIYEFELTAKDSNNASGSQVFKIAVNQPGQTTITVTTNANLKSRLNEFFKAEFKVKGGQSPYQWELMNGKLPTGMNLVEPPQPLAASCPLPTCGNFANDTIYVQGQPVETGSFSFTLAATDNNKNVGTGSFTIIVESKSTPGDNNCEVTNLVPGESTFKAQGNPTIYFYTKDGTKQAYTSMAMLRAWKVEPKTIITLSKCTDLPPDDPTSPIVKLPNNIIVKGSKAVVYLVENGTLRPFASIKAFLNQGHKFSEVIVFPDSDLAPYPIGEPIK